MSAAAWLRVLKITAGQGYEAASNLQSLRLCRERSAAEPAAMQQAQSPGSRNDRAFHRGPARVASRGREHRRVQLTVRAVRGVKETSQQTSGRRLALRSLSQRAAFAFSRLLGRSLPL